MLSPDTVLVIRAFYCILHLLFVVNIVIYFCHLVDVCDVKFYLGIYIL